MQFLRGINEDGRIDPPLGYSGNSINAYEDLKPLFLKVILPSHGYLLFISLENLSLV